MSKMYGKLENFIIIHIFVSLTDLIPNASQHPLESGYDAGKSKNICPKRKLHIFMMTKNHVFFQFLI